MKGQSSAAVRSRSMGRWAADNRHRDRGRAFDQRQWTV